MITEKELERLTEEVLKELGVLCGVAYLNRGDGPGFWTICIHCVDGKLRELRLREEEGDSREILRHKIRDAVQPPQGRPS